MSKRMVVDLDVDKTAIDTNLDKRYHLGSVHSDARAQMPEKQLFSFAEYKAQDAERIGYSNYSYWKSVWQNFLKKKLLKQRNLSEMVTCSKLFYHNV